MTAKKIAHELLELDLQKARVIEDFRARLVSRARTAGMATPPEEMDRLMMELELARIDRQKIELTIGDKPQVKNG